MGRGHSNEEMNMIGHTADAECDSAEFADDAAEVSVEIRLYLRLNRWRSVTSAKDEMD